MSDEQIQFWDDGDDDCDPVEAPKTLRSIKQARTFLQDNLDRGLRCPCCNQFAKRYRRKLNSGMARVLIWLVREFERTGEWVNVPESAPVFVLRSNEVGKLAWWDLVVEKPNLVDASKRSSGIWRPTDKGIAFARCEVRVPERVILYNNTLEGFEGDMASVREALGKKFNYAELMAS